VVVGPVVVVALVVVGPDVVVVAFVVVGPAVVVTSRGVVVGDAVVDGWVYFVVVTSRGVVVGDSVVVVAFVVVGYECSVVVVVV
jgi:NDP-sugar pyrophosphorylase family protein